LVGEGDVQLPAVPVPDVGAVPVPVHVPVPVRVAVPVPVCASSVLVFVAVSVRQRLSRLLPEDGQVLRQVAIGRPGDSLVVSPASVARSEARGSTSVTGVTGHLDYPLSLTRCARKGVSRRPARGHQERPAGRVTLHKPGPPCP